MRKTTGQLGQALVSDVELLELFLAHTFSSFIVAVIMILSILSVLLTINPLLSFVLLIAAILLGCVPYFLRKRADRQGKDVREKLSDSNSLMIEGVQGLREIVTLNGRQNYLTRITEQMKGLYKAQEIYGRRKGQEGMMQHILGGVFTIIVMLIAHRE